MEIGSGFRCIGGKELVHRKAERQVEQMGVQGRAVTAGGSI
jgi:hypothetical protein